MSVRRRSRWRTWAAVGASLVVGGLALGSSAESAAAIFPVDGTFILWDNFPALSAGELCDAKRSFYHDINEDTLVRAERTDGAELAQTTLGSGRILAAPELARVIGRTTPDEIVELGALLEAAKLQPCLFEFRLTLESGSDAGNGYIIMLGHRATWQLSEERLREPGALQLSIGLR